MAVRTMIVPEFLGGICHPRHIEWAFEFYPFENISKTMLTHFRVGLVVSPRSFGTRLMHGCHNQAE